MLSRRRLLRQLALLGAGLGAAWWLRERYLFPTPQVEFAGGRADTGWLPLTGPSGLVELPARLAGLPIRVVVDSGAQFSAIDANLARRLGLKPMPLPMLAFGVSGAPAITHTIDLDLTIGPMTVRGLRAATLDLLALSGAMRQPFAMLVGRDLLSVAAADIDWPAKRVALMRPEVLKPGPGWRLVPTHSRARALMTDVSLEGGDPVEVMVDTGATAEIALSETAARRLGLLQGRAVETGRSVSLGGFSRDRVVRVAEITFAGRRLTDIEVQVFTPAAQAPLPDGLLGVGLLRRYRVGLDLTAGRLWLAGGEAEAPPAARTPRAVLSTS
jgi:predicted aspartyl protease